MASIFGSTTSTSDGVFPGANLNIAYPTGIQSGDVLLILVEHRGSGIANAPSGFSNWITETASTASKTYVFYKVADGTETGNASILITDGFAIEIAGVMLGIRNATVDISKGASSSLYSNTQPLVCPSVSSDSTDLILRIGMVDGDVTFTAPAGTTFVAEVSSGGAGAGRVYVARETGLSPVTGTADMSISPSFDRDGRGITLALASTGLIPTINSGIIANWLLDGDSLDESGNHYNFTNTGVDFVEDVPSALSNVISKCGEWVQSTDVLTRSYAVALNPTEFTLCLWHKAAIGSNGAYRTLLDCRDLGVIEAGWRLYASNTNRYQLWLYNGSGPTIVQSTTAVAEDTWQHFAATYDGTSCRVYVDGVLERTTTALHVVNTSIPTQISTHFDSFNLKGRVSNPRIYASARPDAEIAAIYAGDYVVAPPSTPTRRTLRLDTRIHTRLRTKL